ncbi:anticodon-binding protein [Aspergillus venezuelensis]
MPIGTVPATLHEVYVLSLPISVAPTKVLIVSLTIHPAFAPLTATISEALRDEGISCRTDESSASIGKRYARNDELGIPLGITVDFNSVEDGTVTFRERDSTKQVRASQEDILRAVRSLVAELENWNSVCSRLPKFLGQSGDD